MTQCTSIDIDTCAAGGDAETAGLMHAAVVAAVTVEAAAERWW